MSGYFADSRPRADQYFHLKVAFTACLLLFLLAAFAAYSLLSAGDSGVESLITDLSGVPLSAEKVAVLIPVQAIDSGTALEPLMFRVEEKHKDEIPAGIFTGLEQLKGLYAKTLILPNYPLQYDYTTRTKPVNEVTNLIPEGYRGVTIRVDERSGIEGWARAGSRVDVTWLSTVLGKPAITVIVQNSLVISAGKNLQGDNPPGAQTPTEMTLLVTKDDARRIMLGQQTGALSLSLRGMFDTGKGNSDSTLTTDDLLGNHSSPSMSVRIIVVGIQDDDGIYDYFHWQDGQLVPTEDKGPFA